MATSKIDWSKQPMGTMPDAELGAKLGVSESCVWRARQRFSVPSFCNKGVAGKKRCPQCMVTKSVRMFFRASRTANRDILCKVCKTEAKKFASCGNNVLTQEEDREFIVREWT